MEHVPQKNRNKQILEMRKEGLKFKEIGMNFNLTHQRIQQICASGGLCKTNEKIIWPIVPEKITIKYDNQPKTLLTRY